MATKTWDGSSNSFSNPAAWSPTGAPQPGDTAVINSGTVGVASATLNGLTIQMSASPDSTPTLSLRGATIGSGSQVVAAANSGTTQINVAGAVANAGLISFTGPSKARFTTTLTDIGGGSPTLLRNNGSIAAINASANVVATAAGQALENNGAISAWNPSRGIQFAIVGPAITGKGVIMVDAYAQIELVNSVSADQTVQFLNNGAGHSTLQLDQPLAFQGAIEGFAATDTVTLRSTPFTSYRFNMTDASGGVLTLDNNGATVASLKFTGTYRTSDFNLAFADLGGGLSSTLITTSQAAGPQAFHITDATLNQSTTTARAGWATAAARRARCPKPCARPPSRPSAAWCACRCARAGPCITTRWGTTAPAG